MKKVTLIVLGLVVLTLLFSSAYTVQEGQQVIVTQFGEPVGEPLSLPETSEGLVTPLPNGNVAVTTSGAISSIFYYMVNRILPERLQVDGPPEAGLLLLEPR